MLKLWNWELIGEDDTSASNGGGGTPDASQTESTTNVEDTDTDVSGTDNSSAETENTETQSGEDGKGRGKQLSDHVPYSRFREVNEARIEAERRSANSEARIADMERRLSEYTRPKPKEDTDPERRKVVDYYVRPELKETNDRLAKLEEDIKIERENMKLDKTLDGLAVTYSSVKEVPHLKAFLTNTYAMDEKSNLAQMTKEFHNYLATRDKKVIADYIAGKSKTAEHKSGIKTFTPASVQNKKLPANASMDDRFALATKSAVARLEQSD